MCKYCKCVNVQMKIARKIELFDVEFHWEFIENNLQSAHLLICTFPYLLPLR